MIKFELITLTYLALILLNMPLQSVGGNSSYTQIIPTAILNGWVKGTHTDSVDQIHNVQCLYIIGS